MTVNQTEVRLSGLPQATQVNVSVTALAGHAAAETVTIVTFTGNSVLVLSLSITNNFLFMSNQR